MITGMKRFFYHISSFSSMCLHLYACLCELMHRYGRMCKCMCKRMCTGTGMPAPGFYDHMMFSVLRFQDYRSVWP